MLTYIQSYVPQHISVGWRMEEGEGRRRLSLSLVAGNKVVHSMATEDNICERMWQGYLLIMYLVIL